MSGPQTPEPTLEGQADASVGSPDEDAADGTQHSHRMLSFSDALLSIIATVMVRGGPGPLRGGRGQCPGSVPGSTLCLLQILPVTHTEISPEQVLRNRLQCVHAGGGPGGSAHGLKAGLPAGGTWLGGWGQVVHHLSPRTCQPRPGL